MDFFSISILFFIILASAIFVGGFYDAMWTPTKKEDYDRIALLACLKPGVIFYDLGCGSANMLFYFSKKYGTNCVGIEVAPFWYLYSKVKSLFYKKVKIKYGNFYKHNISEADVIYVFLLPEAYLKLKNKIDKESKKGAKIILSDWPFEGREPNKTAKKEGSVPYYLYQK